MIVEPHAGDRVEDNLNPVGRAYYGVLDAAVHAGLAVAGGRAGARRPGRRGAHPRRRRGGRLHALPPRRRDAVQPRVRGAPVTGARSQGRDATGDAETRRAHAPDDEGFVEPRRRAHLLRGPTATGAPTILLLPTWTIVHCAVLEAAGPLPRPTTSGSSRSTAAATAARDRPPSPAAYAVDARRRPTRWRCSTPPAPTRPWWSRPLAAAPGRRCCWRPTTPSGCSARCSSARRCPSTARSPEQRGARERFDERARRPIEGWEKYNAQLLARDHYEDFLEFFFAMCFPEPHSTKPVEDCVAWGLETDAGELVAPTSRHVVDRERVRAEPARACAARCW